MPYNAETQPLVMELGRLAWLKPECRKAWEFESPQEDH